MASPERMTRFTLRAIAEVRVLMPRNYDDFLQLHNLVMMAQGHHPGILVLRQDNDRRWRMAPHEVVRALRNLEAAGYLVVDKYTILNAWQ